MKYALASEAAKASRTVEAENRKMSQSGGGHGGAGGGHGGGMLDPRMRGMMAMHSARSVMDMTMAGQSPLRALEMEGPRLAELVGLGLGPTIGIAAAVAGLGKLVSAYHDAGEAKKEFAKAGESINGSGTKVNQYEEEIGQIVKARDEFREKTNGFWSNYAEMLSNVPRMAFGYDPTKGDRSPQEQGRDQEEAAKSAQIVTLQGQKVARIKEEVDLRARATAEGDRAVKVDQLDLQMRQEIQAAQARAALVPELSADKEVEQIKRRFQLEKDAATFEKASYEQSIALRRRQAEIDVPGITKNSLGFDPEDLRAFKKAKPVAHASADYNDALSTLQRTRDEHQDDTGAKQHVLDTQKALAEVLRSEKESTAELQSQANIQKLLLSGHVTEANNLTTLLPMQKAITKLRQDGKDAEADTTQSMLDQLELRQKMQAFFNPAAAAAERAAVARDEINVKRYRDGGLTHDASRDGSFIHDANGPGGSSIPDAGRTGGRAAHAPDLIPDNAPIPDLPGLPNFQGTANMFGRTTAGGRLGRARSARDVMAGHRGDPDHDPARRLRDAHTFRSRAEMRADQAAQFHPRNAAEAHRTNTPQRQQPDQNAAQMLGALVVIRADVAALKAKIGVA